MEVLRLPDSTPAVSHARTATSSSEPQVKLAVSGLSFFYGQFQAIKDITFDIYANKITALIGASACGKSTVLRNMNRIAETVRGTRHTGNIYLDGENVFTMDVTALRRRAGMVFQKPNPFPKSIFENVAWGIRTNEGNLPNSELDGRVEIAFTQAAVWDEVKDILTKPASGLSGGQQQRLCIARALAINPEVLLLDEPCSALDPTATSKIEELLFQLKDRVTIVIVTHNMQQAGRISDHTAYMSAGRLIEIGETGKIMVNPQNPLTEEYLCQSMTVLEREDVKARIRKKIELTLKS